MTNTELAAAPDDAGLIDPAEIKPAAINEFDDKHYLKTHIAYTVCNKLIRIQMANNQR